jgi:hypothetical protein
MSKEKKKTVELKEEPKAKGEIDKMKRRNSKRLGD